MHCAWPKVDASSIEEEGFRCVHYFLHSIWVFFFFFFSCYIDKQPPVGCTRPRTSDVGVWVVIPCLVACVVVLYAMFGTVISSFICWYWRRDTSVPHRCICNSTHVYTCTCIILPAHVNACIISAVHRCTVQHDICMISAC